ncbi:sigma 54-interacting transcriptional regulator [Bacteroidetes bacterium endosymbiont of Geopemphigus sp.]|uniref:sigma 54-interacting transcriptional regulator n=1 Tax=Bacteroidetes bacterium endosymbiont of Geopemphigus sp. TaxID=2047937 RepID=UPI000CD07937|nr:sigma-54 dependent transcriptional regulator [Bacteroidetes bacterium endosymbiont of Geopemphigus sp.]
MESIQSIKQRFRIIGNDPMLNRALEKSIQVSPTDISVLVIGESGVGKEFIPKIIHQLSSRKHHSYIAVNCGAIPEGTIDSELFGHEKGAFTGATALRKGYFEVADKGTIFLDEVGELPLTTQVRLLRVLESGEFLKVGSSQIQKTDVRIVAATNVNMLAAIKKTRFREDLYYRLNTIQIDLPSLRARRGDIALLFRKFSQDFAEKYHMPVIRLSAEAMSYIENYPWPGNIRQLRNFAEQLSVVETNREISVEKIKEYLPEHVPLLSSAISSEIPRQDFGNERDLLYKVLFDMRKDLNDLKSLTLELMRTHPGDTHRFEQDHPKLVKKVFGDIPARSVEPLDSEPLYRIEDTHEFNLLEEEFDYEEIHEEQEQRLISESLSLQEKEIEFIRKALKRNEGRRKMAAHELGISERTLYRKIKQYGL